MGDQTALHVIDPDRFRDLDTHHDGPGTGIDKDVLHRIVLHTVVIGEIGRERGVGGKDDVARVLRAIVVPIREVVVGVRHRFDAHGIIVRPYAAARRITHRLIGG